MKERSTRTPVVSVLGLMGTMLMGCPQPSEDEPDAFEVVDAFAELDASADIDAAAEMEDAASPSDAFVPPDATFDGGPPDAAGPPCTTPGSMRMQPCSCGYTRRETCIDGNWRTTEPCNYTSATCDPGTTRPYDWRCSVGIQRCTDRCVWGPPEYTVPEGECAAGIRCPGTECTCRADCTCPIYEGGVCLP